MQVNKRELEPDMVQWTGSKLERSTSKQSIVILLTYAEYIMQNAGLDEAKARIKTARRNINNLRYADDTTFIIEN